MRLTAVAGAIVAAGALFLPWFELRGNFLVLFGAVDRISDDFTFSGWEAFGWQDLALLACALAIFVAVRMRNTIVGIAAAIAGIVLTLTMIGNPPGGPALGALQNPPPFSHTASVWLAVAGFAVAALALGAANRADA